MAYLGQPPDFGIEDRLQEDLLPDYTMFGGQGASDVADDELWLQRARRALRMADAIGMSTGQSRDAGPPLEFQRLSQPEDPPGFLKPREQLSSRRQKFEKGLDVASLVTGFLAEREARKHGRRYQRGGPLLYQRRAEEDAYRAEQRQKTEAANAAISNQESRANWERTNRVADREGARLNAILPSIMSSVLKDRSADRGAYSDKLTVLYGTDSYKNASPEEQALMEQRAMGVEAPRPTESTYDKELARYRARSAASAMYPDAIRNRAAARGVSVDESDVRFASDQMARFVHELGMTEQEASEAAWGMLEERRSIRNRLAGGRPIQPNIGMDDISSVMQRSQGPMFGSAGLAANAGSDPAIQQKLRVYRKQVQMDPSRRELLRRAIMEEHGFDPETVDVQP